VIVRDLLSNGGVSHDSRRIDIMTFTLERTRPREIVSGHDHRSAIMAGNANTWARYKLADSQPQKLADENELTGLARGVSGVLVRCVSSVPNCSNFTSDSVAVWNFGIADRCDFEDTYHFRA